MTSADDVQRDFENARVEHGLAKIRLEDAERRTRGERGQSIDNYLDIDQENLDRLRVLLPHFRALMPVIHQLYDRSQELIPPDDPFSIILGRSLLICHKSFLAAAGTIARRHPDDAAPLTRRAIEAASFAVAVKHDPKNVERWSAAEQRLARWTARHQGSRVPRLRPLGIRYPENAVLEELRQYEGVLSDAFVHFTPEFIEGQTWRRTDHGERVIVDLIFLETNQRIIEREVIMLAAIHDRILDLFDECVSGAFSNDATWKAAKDQLTRRGAALGELFRRALPPDQNEAKEGMDGPTR